MRPKRIEPEPREEARTIARGGLVNLSGDVLDLLGVPLLYLFIGRVLGSGALGLYVLVSSYVAILLRLCVLGFDKAMLRFVPAAASAGAEASVLGTALRWSFGASLVACLVAAAAPDVLLAIGGDVGPGTAARWLRIMALAIPALAASRVLLFALRGRSIMWAFVVVQSLIAPMSLIAATALPVLIGSGSDALPAGFVASAALTLVAAIAVFAREFSGQTARSVLRSPRDADVLRFSFPQGLSEAVNFVMARVDILMIAAFFPNRMDLVAFYGVASLLAGVVKRVRVAFDNSFSPVFARQLAEDDRKAARRTFRETGVGITALFALVAGAICFASPAILSFYGPEYRAFWIAVPLLISGRLLNAAGGPAQAALLMAGRSRLELANNIGLCALNIGLNWLLIPRYGVYGAAAAAALSLTLLNLVRMLEVRGLLGLWADGRGVTATLLAGFAAASPAVIVFLAVPARIPASVAAAAVFSLFFFAMSGKVRSVLPHFKPGGG